MLKENISKLLLCFLLRLLSTLARETLKPWLSLLKSTPSLLLKQRMNFNSLDPLLILCWSWNILGWSLGDPWVILEWSLSDPWVILGWSLGDPWVIWLMILILFDHSDPYRSSVDPSDPVLSSFNSPWLCANGKL